MTEFNEDELSKLVADLESVTNREVLNWSESSSSFFVEFDSFRVVIAAEDDDDTHPFRLIVLSLENQRVLSSTKSSEVSRELADSIKSLFFAARESALGLSEKKSTLFETLDRMKRDSEPF